MERELPSKDLFRAMTPPVIAMSGILRLRSEQAPQSRRNLPLVVARLTRSAEAIPEQSWHLSIWISPNSLKIAPLKIRGAKGVMEIIEVTPFHPPYFKGEVWGKRQFWHLTIWI